MRQVALTEARMVASSVNWRHCEQLSGTMADLGTAPYDRLAEQLRRIRKMHPRCRLAYLLRQDANGAVISLVDSEAPGSPDHSPPGRVLTAVDPSITQTFTTWQGATWGPVRDRWGVWVRSTAAVLNPDTGQLVAVLGLDTDARDWNRVLLAHAAGQVSLVLLIGIVIIVLLASRAQAKRENRELARYASALAESEERYRRIVETANEGIWAMDGEMRTTYVNRQLTEFLGYSPEEMLGRRVDEFMFEEDLEEHAKEISRRSRGESSRYERRFRHRDGSVRWLAVSATPIMDALGRFAGSFAMFTDITERRAIEEKLRQQALVLDQIHDCVTVTDLDGVITYVNDAEISTLGYSREELIGRSVRQYGDDAARGATQEEIIERTLRDGEWRGEVVNYTADGRAVILDCRTRLVHDLSGKPIAMCGIATDITEQKRAEEALRQSQERLQSILRVAPVGIGVVHNRVFTEVNPRVCQMTGYSREELIGQNARLLYPTQEEFEFVGTDKYRQIVEDGLGTVETRWITKDGRIIDVLIASTPTDPDDESLGVTFTALDITERKQATEALRKSENLLRRALEVVPVGLWIADAEGNLLSGNEAARRIWGAHLLPRRDEYGLFKARRLPSGEEVGPDDWAIVRTLSEGVTVLDELLEIETFDGRTRIVHNSTAPVMDDDGNIEAVIIVNQDITERAITERALRASEERYRIITHTSPLSIMLIRKGRLLFANPTAVRIFGRSQAYELVGARIGELIGREQFKRIADSLQRPPGAEPDMPMGMSITRPDGTVAHVEVVASHIQLEDGPAILAMAVDVTQRKRAETQAEQLKSVFDHAQFGAVISDLNGRLTYINPAMAHQHGYEPEELLGGNISDLHSAEQMDAVESLLQTLLTEGRFAPTEVWHLHRDGHTFPMLMTGVALFDEEGRPTALAATAVDITDRKRAEDSARLATVGQLAAGVAHEFNNLLAGLLLASERAMFSRDIVDYERLAEMTRRQALRGAEICRGLSAFSRPPELTREPIHLETPIDCALSLASHQLSIAGVEVVRDAGPDTPRILADAGQLEQVFVNLFINAAHAMPDGGTLTVTTRHLPAKDGPGQVVARVSDTGVGMSPETLRRIFEPFFTTKGRLGESDVPGTGLGLTVSHGIVTAHGGTIAVRSELGRGTTFELTFPVYEPGELETKRSDSTRPMDWGDTAVGHILLVEDEPDVRDTLAAVLRHYGHRVRTAGAAPEAIRELDERQFDIVITDLLLPGGGGRAVLQHCARLSKPIPVLVVTGQDSEDADRKVLQMGARGLLRKPVTAQQMLAEIRRVLDEQRATATPDSTA
ncbi:MAG: PAS domain S-box protein [Armatimonadetes bacterium]|nr:PAS domain S-box protein [Armatimonadota bacterium]